jgi:hypothetical protein
LRFYEKPRQKFVFFNSKAKKPERLCYSSTIRAIANYLPEAQAVARQYIVSRKSEPSQFEEQAENAQTNSSCKPKEVNGVEAEARAAQQCKGDDLLYCKFLSQYGKDVKIKNNLQVNIYKEQSRIWLKPWWRTPSDDESNDSAPKSGSPPTLDFNFQSLTGDET